MSFRTHCTHSPSAAPTSPGRRAAHHARCHLPPRRGRAWGLRSGLSPRPCSVPRAPRAPPAPPLAAAGCFPLPRGSVSTRVRLSGTQAGSTLPAERLSLRRPQGFQGRVASCGLVTSPSSAGVSQTCARLPFDLLSAL